MQNTLQNTSVRNTLIHQTFLPFIVRNKSCINNTAIDLYP